MALSRHVARPLLASTFILDGWDAIRNPAGRTLETGAVTEPLNEMVARASDETAVWVRVNGGVQVGAGVLLAIGKFPRLASLALIGSIIPTTYAGHRFWEEADDTTRAQQKMHFLKNLGLLGGLILAAMDTEGEPSLGWRAKRRAGQLEAALALSRGASTAKAHRTTSKAHSMTSNASKVSKRAARKADAVARSGAQRANAVGRDVAHSANSAGLDTARHVRATGFEAGRQANMRASDAARQANTTLASATRQASSKAADTTRQVKPAAFSAAHSGVELAGPYLTTGADRASELLSKVGEHLPAS